MTPNIEKIRNEIANTDYTDINGTTAKYGQVPGLNSKILSSLNQIRQDTLEEIEREIDKRKLIEEDKKEISNLEHDKMYHRGWIHCLDYVSDIIQSKKEKI